VVDEEDIAQSVFSSICRGAAAGRFDNVNNRDELWWLLLAITKHKAVNFIRRETRQIRGEGRVRCEAQMGGEDGSKAFRLDELVGRDPAPDFVAMLDEEYQGLLTELGDDRLRQIAGLRIEGYEVSEIADKLGVSLRTVERKLNLIRSRWSKLLPN
jgi:DNA-directed RNA polymerase specialized sigma24 family protein